MWVLAVRGRMGSVGKGTCRYSSSTPTRARRWRPVILAITCFCSAATDLAETWTAGPFSRGAAAAVFFGGGAALGVAAALRVEPFAGGVLGAAGVRGAPPAAIAAPVAGTANGSSSPAVPSDGRPLVGRLAGALVAALLAALLATALSASAPCSALSSVPVVAGICRRRPALGVVSCVGPGTPIPILACVLVRGRALVPFFAVRGGRARRATVLGVTVSLPFSRSPSASCPPSSPPSSCSPSCPPSPSSGTAWGTGNRLVRVAGVWATAVRIGAMAGESAAASSSRSRSGTGLPSGTRRREGFLYVTSRARERACGCGFGVAVVAVVVLDGGLGGCRSSSSDPSSDAEEGDSEKISRVDGASCSTGGGALALRVVLVVAVGLGAARRVRFLAGAGVAPWSAALVAGLALRFGGICPSLFLLRSSPFFLVILLVCGGFGGLWRVLLVTVVLVGCGRFCW